MITAIIKEWIAANLLWVFIGCVSFSVVLELIVLQHNTGFKSFRKVYDYIAGQYYRAIKYVNIFEHDGKLSIGRVLFFIASVIAFRWCWHYKDIGVCFLVFLIFLGGYVLFNKPFLVTALESKVKGLLGKAADNVDTGGGEPDVTDEGGEDPNDV